MDPQSNTAPEPATLTLARPASTRKRVAHMEQSSAPARASAADEARGGAKKTRELASERRRIRARAAQKAGVLRRLWREWRKSKTPGPRNALALAYQDLVQTVVRRFAVRLPRSVDRGDLGTAANFGLMAAIESFDPSMGVRFESYGELRIRGALLDELRSEDWLPRPWRTRLERHKRVVESLRAAKGGEPCESEIAAALELGLGEYRQLFAVALPGAPSGAHTMATGESSGDVEMLDVVMDPHHDTPEERLSREELLRLVAQRLSEQEYRIVYLKYWEELSMREIGELESLSESRVCKIHTKLLERLQDRLRVQYGGK
ncbi:MAG TPA: sigma-70 family RNA polymerase sigma factor [Planctomycetota bacterium]|nr:sigma-70 family RNA polymerase sigma factor [Planctomycetota bacterium]